MAIVAEHLVSALHGDKVEDAAYGIQELLRLSRATTTTTRKGRRRELPKWARKAFEQRNVHELVAPYASTDYVMKGKAKLRDKSETNATATEMTRGSGLSISLGPLFAGLFEDARSCVQICRPSAERRFVAPFYFLSSCRCRYHWWECW